MAGKRLRIVAPFALVALMIGALHTFEEHQAYKTGIYMGKVTFEADDFQNRQCLSLRRDSFQRVCKVTDLNQESAMEDALASAKIIPSLADSTALHTGFRDGWTEARAAAFADR